MAKEEEKKTGALAMFTKGGNLPTVDAAAAAAALMNSADEGTSGTTDGVFLTFSGKKDKWSLGQNNDQPDPDTVYIADLRFATEGWVCWKGGRPVEKHQWPTLEKAQRAIPAGQLKDHGPYSQEQDGWQFELGISMFDVDDAGTRIIFTTNSKSGRNAFAKSIIEEGAKRWIEDGTETPPFPVFQLSSEQFQSHGQWNGKPVFDVLGWVTEAEVAAFLEDGEVDIDGLLEGRYEGGIADAEEVAEEEPEEKPAPKANAKTRKRRARA